MPEIRHNLATGEWVIIATERAKRPEQFIQVDKERVEERPEFVAECPFCPGNEELDLERLRMPEQGPWRLRVVRNRYPALEEHGEWKQSGNSINSAIAGVGYHEVLVESPIHNTCPALEPVEDVERMLLAFQLRGCVMREDRRIEHIVYFKNHGPTAGTSLLHPHTQMVALPVVPYTICVRVEEARRYFGEHNECVMCRVCQEEEREQTRMIAASEHFSAFVPFAAYSPFHVWIVPRRHNASFLDTSGEELRDLGAMLRDILRRLYFGLNDPDYNYVIRSAPERERGAAYIHWYLAIVPRVSKSAGFELASGMFINTALPEESARFLRDTVVRAMSDER